MHNDRMEYEWIKNEINERAAIWIESPKGEIQELLLQYYEESAGWRNAIINWAKSLIPDTIETPDRQPVLVSRTSIRDTIAHGKGPLKILTIPYIPEILIKSVLYYTEKGKDKQGRAETFYNYAYPLIFEGSKYVISISIKEDFNGKRFYDDEFIQGIKSTDGLAAATGPSTRGNLTHPSTITILRDILGVKYPGEDSKNHSLSSRE
jgi:hypothetical protein